jgi:predicted regulator of amino acid metabolism with ACT domain
MIHLSMWDQLEKDFSRTPSQGEIAKYMLDVGIRLQGEKLYFDKVSISHSQVAEALGKDKRIVTATVKTIKKNKELYRIFSKVQPTCNLMNMAHNMGWGVICIELDDPNMPGTLGRISTKLGEMKISIRQAQCPATACDVLYVITDNPITGDVITALKDVQNVKTIKLFN